MNGIIDEFRLPEVNSSIIKVVGVGGGGSNAVNHMYMQNISDVSFVICNTDDQALKSAAVPTKIQIGKDGLGAGNRPTIAQEAAESSREEIENMFNDGTRMTFITAGMGGGTGTGAAPVVAAIAKEMGILTVGIVTIPFIFEGKKKILQALDGIIEMSKNVDALLVIHNDKLRTIYPDLDLTNAFKKADNVLTDAARGIAEIITQKGHINVDFADVSTIMRNGGVAVMNSGTAEGEKRISNAINDALNSPLLNDNDIHKSKKILLNFYCSESNPVYMKEVDEINEFMDKMGDDIEVIWGVNYDNSLGDAVKVTLLATGSDMDIIPHELQDDPKFSGKVNNRTANTDPKSDWMEELYGKGINSGKSNKIFTLKDIENDDNILLEMESVPAYKRIK
ncbi:MAG: cell division protein FtsZ [bacterium]